MKILVPLWIPTTHTTNVCCPKNYAMSPLCLRPWRETTGGYLIFHLIAPSSAHRRERESQAFKFLLKAECQKKLSRILFRNSKMLRRRQKFSQVCFHFFRLCTFELCPRPQIWVPLSAGGSGGISSEHTSAASTSISDAHNIRRKRKARSNISSDLKSLLKRG